MAELTVDQVEKIIWDKLHIKHNDVLPFTGWDRTFNRDRLAELFGELGYKVGVELGVKQGRYSRLLCDKIPGLKLYSIDPYNSYGGHRPSIERQNSYYEYAKNLLAPYDATIIKKTSLQAVTDFKDGSLDFIFIDAMHRFDYVMLDLICWTPKIRIGGIVSGHDYVEGFDGGVVNAVRSYTYAHNINEWYLTYDPKGEEMPINSWFFVRKPSHGYLVSGNLW